MGNKLTRSSNESRFTKPTGLYPTCEWDEKTVKKLINKKKIAPRYPGREDGGPDLDECPICFLWYPGGLNRSKCCRQPICTECFLQFKKPTSHKPVQCPFCNAFNYAVKYSGSITKEEREAIEQEEQKVIEAKIRMRQEEMARDAERQKELAAERERRAKEGPPPAPPRPPSPPPVPRQSSRREEDRRHDSERSRYDGERHQRRRTPPRSPRSYDSRHQHQHRHHQSDRREHRRREYEEERGDAYGYEEERGDRRWRGDEDREERVRRDRDRERERDRGAERRRHEEREDEADESGLSMDIEELMVMEAIRLSLLDKAGAGSPEGAGGGGGEEDVEEAGAAGRGEEEESEGEAGEMAAGRRFSDDEEDWPATAWDGEQGGMYEPGARSDTPALDAALWRVEGEMAQSALLGELLAYGRGWFDATGGAKRRGLPREGGSPDPRGPSAQSASQPAAAASPTAPLAYEPSSTLSPKAPAAIETPSTLSPVPTHPPPPAPASPEARSASAAEQGAAAGEAGAEEEEEEESAIAEGELPIERAPMPEHAEGDEEVEEAAGGGDAEVGEGRGGAQERGSWGDGEAAILRLEPEGGAALPGEMPDEREGGETEGAERRAWEDGEDGAGANSTITSEVEESGADEEARAYGGQHGEGSDGLEEEQGRLLQDMDVAEFETPPPARGERHEGNGHGNGERDGEEPLNEAASRIQSFWRGKAGNTPGNGAEVKVSAPPALEEGVSAIE